MKSKAPRIRVVLAVLTVFTFLIAFTPVNRGWANQTGGRSALQDNAKVTPTPVPQILSEKIDIQVLDAFKDKPNEKISVIIYMKEQADFSKLNSFSDDSSLDEVKQQRDDVYKELTETAQKTQGTVLTALQGPAGSGKALANDIESFWIINGVGATLDQQTILQLAGMPEVERIYIDEEFTLPPEESVALPSAGSGGGTSEGNWGIAKIRADKVWSDLNIDGSGIVVGTIDTGVNKEHPALKARYRGNHTYHVYSFRDFVGDKLAPYDDHGHGTHTLGIIGGEGGAGNGIGVAPGAEWISAKGINAHGGAMARSMLRAMAWIQAPEGIPSLAPDLVSNSWSFPCTSDYFRTAIRSWRAAGIVPLFSAGNAGPNPETVRQPACFPEAIAVGATDSTDTIASFSSRGPSFKTYTKPDLSAPGVNIYSSVLGQDYANYSGTSMAVPFVAGVVALMLQANPSLSINQILEELKTSAVDLGASGADNTYGWGRVDAYNAVHGQNTTPGGIVLVAPQGDISETQPSYQWEPADGANKYQVRVRSAAGQDIIAAWYQAADVCSASVCAVQPAKSLEKGSYTWQVQFSDAEGEVSPWSEAMDFKVGAAPTPAAAVLVSPSGEINDASPTYVWKPVSSASKYLLKVSDADAKEYVSSWYEAKTVCGADTCQVKTTTTLSAGEYTWKVQSASASANGAWSTEMAFSVKSVPVPLAPSGDVQDASPAYKWKGVDDATKYQLKVSDQAGKQRISAWYQATDVCSGDACAVKTTTSLEQGSYTWQVQAANESSSGEWSSAMSFRVTQTQPQSPTLLSPSGDTPQTQPTFQWKPMSDASEYKLKLSKSSGETILATWYTDEVCSGTVCSVKPSLTLALGGYSWQVQSSNGNSNSAWSKALAFTVVQPAPPAAKPIAPSGAIREAQPTYEWNAVEGATEYRLKVSSTQADVIRTWYKAQDVCFGNTCSVKPAQTLEGGDYSWQVQTSNSACGGEWSAAMQFSVTASSPNAATLLMPSGDVTDSQPTFRWNAVPGAKEYQMKINDTTGKIVYNKWFRSADFCTVSLCTARISSVLPSGKYTWQVQASSPSGDGEWSDALKFTVLELPPAAPTLLSPSGNITDLQPVYKWNMQKGASEYDFRVNKASGEAVFTAKYQAGDVCSNSICSVRPSIEVDLGTYTWQVRAGNSAGNGAWNSSMTFIVSSPPLAASALMAPAGQIGEAQPKYQWYFVQGATQYQLKIIGPQGDSPSVMQFKYQAAEVCSGLLCTSTPPFRLTDGKYSWQVMTSSPAGAGAWSKEMQFTLNTKPVPVNTPVSSPAVPLVPASPSAPAAGGETYLVKPGDSLANLARTWGVVLDDLAQLIQIPYPYVLREGQTLLKPAISGKEVKETAQPAQTPTVITTPVESGQAYSVQAGDFLMKLAREWDVSWEDIVKLNNLKYPYSLQPGQVLKRP